MKEILLVLMRAEMSVNASGIRREKNEMTKKLPRLKYSNTWKKPKVFYLRDTSSSFHGTTFLSCQERRNATENLGEGSYHIV